MFLGQDYSAEAKFTVIEPTRPKMGPTTRLASCSTWWALFCTSWRSPLTSFSHGLLFLKKWCDKKTGYV
jgi:hypothetical protein